MLNEFKLLLVVFFSYIKYYKAVKGKAVTIQNSYISTEVSIFRYVNILASSIGIKTLIYSHTGIYNSILQGDNKVGKYCNLNKTTLGRFSYVADNSIINNADIGKYSSIGPGVKIGLGEHPINYVSSSPYFYNSTSQINGSFNEYEKTYIGHDVWIGANVFVKDGVKIGNGSIIAAGAIVVKDVDEYSIVGGVPAKFLRFRHDIKIINFLKEINWWSKDDLWITKNITLFQRPVTSIEDLSFKD